MIEVDVTLLRLFAEGAGDLQLQLTLATGSLTAIVGPSGAGKTTLLRLLAGLELPRRGRIAVGQTVWLDTQTGTNLPPQQRSIGYVFQDTALFPNMTVRDNIRYAARPGQPGAVDELLHQAGLTAFASQKPAALSGGQRQRVALARALVRRPAVLLLDEPFAALDAQASQELRQMLGQLHQAWGTTTLLVSHHEADVQALATRMVRLVQGRLVADTPVAQPATSTLTERIERIYYDEAAGHWVLITATLQIHAVRPDWQHRRVGDAIQLSWPDNAST